MNAIGFDPRLGLVRVAGRGELFPPRALAASYASGMITVTRVATGDALIYAPFTAIGTLDGSDFPDAPSCLAYLTWALATRPDGDPVRIERAAIDLSGQRAVRATGVGTIAYASAIDPTLRGAVLGVTATAATAGDPVDVVTSGPLTSAGWGLTPGLPLFLGADGILTQTPPTSPGACVLRLGHATEPDTVLIRIGAAITLT